MWDTHSSTQRQNCLLYFHISKALLISLICPAVSDPLLLETGYKLDVIGCICAPLVSPTKSDQAVLYSPSLCCRICYQPANLNHKSSHNEFYISKGRFYTCPITGIQSASLWEHTHTHRRSSDSETKLVISLSAHVVFLISRGLRAAVAVDCFLTTV